MRPGITIHATPMAPPTPTGRPGGFGLWEATATFPNGVTVWAGGHGEQQARANAERRAAREWQELRAHLTACELERDAEEAGWLDPRD